MQSLRFWARVAFRLGEVMEEELKLFLCQLDLAQHSGSNGTREHGTKLISESIEYFCHLQGHSFKREVFIGKYRDNSTCPSRVDFVIYSGPVKYALEIDSSNKIWSLEKLIYAKENNYIPIWVRWNSQINMVIPKNIFLVDLTSNRGEKSNLVPENWSLQQKLFD